MLIELNKHDLDEINGGIGVLAVCVIVVCAVIIISAAVSAFNGYSDAHFAR